MAHNIYQTEGFVLRSFNFGEANKYFYFFTKDLGLIGATAQGIREAKSKLRYSLQDFSYTRLDLVRGKQVWRVTNAEKINHFDGLLKNKQQVIFLAKIFNLLKRLMYGEEKNRPLFNDIYQSIIFLNKENLNQINIINLEILTVMRVLKHLGYWGEHKELDYSLQEEISFILLEKIFNDKNNILKEINSSLKQSHL